MTENIYGEKMKEKINILADKIAEYAREHEINKKVEKKKSENLLNGKRI